MMASSSLPESPRGDGTDGARSRLTIRYRHGALRRSDRRAVSVVVVLSLSSSAVVMTRPSLAAAS